MRGNYPTGKKVAPKLSTKVIVRRFKGGWSPTPICRTLKSDLKSEGYLNRTFPGAKRGGMKGEVKRGEVVREYTGPEGE